MKKIIFIILMVLCSLSTAFAQAFSEFVSEMRGDTAVIKSFNDNLENNTLFKAIRADTIDRPENRVYMLKRGEAYLTANNFVLPKRKIVIVGEVNDSAPPAVLGLNGGYLDNLQIRKDFTLKNVAIKCVYADNRVNWRFFNLSGDHIKLTLDNCTFEWGLWTDFQCNGLYLNFEIKNCLIYNGLDIGVLRGNSLFDITYGNIDTLIVENCTFIHSVGHGIRPRRGPIEYAYFNHNTFVNYTNILFTGSQYYKAIFSNNLFVNSQTQPFFKKTETASNAFFECEGNNDDLALGIINLDTLQVDTSVYKEHVGFIPAEKDRKILVTNNALYIDPKYDALVEELHASTDTVNWESQSIKMNERDQAMFDDDVNYPYFQQHSWIEGILPNFAGYDMNTDAWVNMMKLSLKSMTEMIDIPAPVDHISDVKLEGNWPSILNFSYDNPELVAASTGGQPVGDLNWFPGIKASWNSKDEENILNASLESGTPTSVEKQPNLLTYELSPNYPNPFNPTTIINFSIPKDGNVTLKIYNSVGQEVATLVNGYKTAQTYTVTFDASKLASGVYFYTLNAGNFTQSRKMMLLK